jgi:4-carboxymuconolactone decarboxylase
MAKKAAKKAAKEAAKKPAKRPVYRLKDPIEEQMTPPQKALRDAISSGPRGIRKKLNGPFAIWLQAPEFGDLAQRLGAHVRYNTALSPRQSEFAILCTGQKWKAQYEWFAHEPMALKAGVKPQTVKDIKAGRLPKGAPKDERAIYDFVQELYKTRRVSDKNYKRVHSFLGDRGMVELIGIMGYYTLISMTLNVFRADLPDNAPLPFPEPA